MRCDGIARLTRDPELRSLPNGRAVCDMRVAADNGAGRSPTYVDVTTFDKAAEACAKHLRKGRQVHIEGRLVSDEWQANDGTRRSKHKVIGRVQFLGQPNGQGDTGPQQAEEPAQPAEQQTSKVAGDDDIPF